MKATALLSELMEKAGIDTTDEKLKDILAVQVEIPDDIAKELSEKLMTIEAAKPLLKNSIVSDFSKGFLKSIDEELQAEGIEKSEIDAVFNENGKPRPTGKLIIAAMKKIGEAKEKANPANTDKEKTLREEVKTLNTQLADYKEKFVPKEEVDKVRNEWEVDKYDRSIEAYFLSQKWSDNYPADVRPTLAKTVLEKKLSELGAKVVIVGKEPKIVKADDIQSDYFDKSNKLVTFASLASELMLTNKFLEVSKEASSTNTTVTGNSTGKTNSQKLNTTLSLIDKALADQGIK